MGACLSCITKHTSFSTALEQRNKPEILTSCKPDVLTSCKTDVQIYMHPSLVHNLVSSNNVVVKSDCKLSDCKLSDVDLSCRSSSMLSQDLLNERLSNLVNSPSSINKFSPNLSSSRFGSPSSINKVFPIASKNKKQKTESPRTNPLRSPVFLSNRIRMSSKSDMSRFFEMYNKKSAESYELSMENLRRSDLKHILPIDVDEYKDCNGLVYCIDKSLLNNVAMLDEKNMEYQIKAMNDYDFNHFVLYESAIFFKGSYHDSTLKIMPPGSKICILSHSDDSCDSPHVIHLDVIKTLKKFKNNYMSRIKYDYVNHEIVIMKEDKLKEVVFLPYCHMTEKWKTHIQKLVTGL